MRNRKKSAEVLRQSDGLVYATWPAFAGHDRHIGCVCPVWASLPYSNIRIYLEGVSPLCAGLTFGSISKSQG